MTSADPIPCFQQQRFLRSAGIAATGSFGIYSNSGHVVDDIVQRFAQHRGPGDARGNPAHFPFGLHAAKGRVASHYQIWSSSFFHSLKRFVLHHVQARGWLW